MFERRTYHPLYEGAMEPFRMIGNVYFVGNFMASSHLIDTGEGLILIDTGYADTLFLLVHSIHVLGFNPKEIRHIVHTHWHWDHCEATAALAHLTGAKTWIGEKDEEDAKQYFNADGVLRDGDTLSLGNTVLEFMETPGHTKGCISLFFSVSEQGHTYRVGMFGGAGVNTLTPGAYEYEGCVADYLQSLVRLKQEPVDVFIGNHVWNNDTLQKGRILCETGKNLFIDKELWGQFLDFCEKRVLALQK